MFTSTQVAKLFPLSLSLLLITAISTMGQGEKTPRKSQGSTTTRAEPLVIGRGSDSKADSQAPSDPLVRLLRLIEIPTDQNPVGAKRQQDGGSTDDRNRSYEEREFPFIFCGSSGIDAEGFESLQEFWESPSPDNNGARSSAGQVTKSSEPPTNQHQGAVKGQQDSISSDQLNGSIDERDHWPFVFCGMGEISAGDFEATLEFWESPSPGNSAPRPSSGEVTKSGRRTLLKRTRIRRN